MTSVMDEELAEISEDDLITRAVAGDASCFEEIFERYHNMVYGTAYRICGDRHDAEDIMQDTFVRVARALRKFRKDSKFSSWLYRITVNVARDQLKRKAKLHELKEYDAERETASNLHSLNLSLDIIKALAMLSNEERIAVTLTVYEDLTHAEAAKILNCAETTVSWRVFVAKKKLRRYLSKQGY